MGHSGDSNIKQIFRSLLWIALTLCHQMVPHDRFQPMKCWWKWLVTYVLRLYDSPVFITRHGDRENHVFQMEQLQDGRASEGLDPSVSEEGQSTLLILNRRKHKPETSLDFS